MPCLLVGTTLNQQPSVSVKALGQILMWVALLAAVEIVVALRPGRWLLAIGVVAMVTARVARIVLGETPESIGLYTLGIGSIYATAAAALVQARPRLLASQIKWFVWLSVPLMLLQMYGHPEVVHVARTDIHNVLTGRVVLPSFLQPDAFAGYSTIQLRPASFLFANNFLSLALLPVIAFQLGTWRRRELSGIDVGLAAIVVLTMSKALFLAVLVLTLVHLVSAPRWYRRRLGKFWLAFSGCLFAYWLTFPGLFLYNMSPTNALANVNIRYADLMAALRGVDVADVVVQGFGGGVRLYQVEAGTQSALSRLARMIPVLVVGSVLIAPVYLRSWRALRRGEAGLARVALNGVVVTAVALLITSFVEHPIFWIAAGMAGLPFLARRHPPDRTALA